jgi:hypothetical protein
MHNRNHLQKSSKQKRDWLQGLLKYTVIIKDQTQAE